MFHLISCLWTLLLFKKKKKNQEKVRFFSLSWSLCLAVWDAAVVTSGREGAVESKMMENHSDVQLLVRLKWDLTLMMRVDLLDRLRVCVIGWARSCCGPGGGEPMADESCDSTLRWQLLTRCATNNAWVTWWWLRVSHIHKWLSAWMCVTWCTPPPTLPPTLALVRPRPSLYSL